MRKRRYIVVMDRGAGFPAAWKQVAPNMCSMKNWTIADNATQYPRWEAEDLVATLTLLFPGAMGRFRTSRVTW